MDKRYMNIHEDSLPYTISELEEKTKSKTVEKLTKEDVRSFCSNPIFDMSKEEKERLASELLNNLDNSETYHIDPVMLNSNHNFAFAESINELDQDFPEAKEK